MTERPSDGAAEGELVARALAPGETIVWSARPCVGVAPGDLPFAAIGGLALLAIVGADALLSGYPPRETAILAGLTALISFLSLLLARVGGAGTVHGLALATLAPTVPFALLALIARGMPAGLSVLRLACPFATLGLLCLWLALRFVQLRDARFHLSATRAFVEEAGRYVIAFELRAPPRVRLARLSAGRVGALEFEPAPGRLLTISGRRFDAPPRARRFVRVLDPEKALAALAQRIERSS